MVVLAKVSIWIHSPCNHVQMAALLLLLLPAALGQEACSARVLGLQEARAANNQTILVGRGGDTLPYLYYPSRNRRSCRWVRPCWWSP
jgi:hypothetical protein